jgi:SAM-dependent methyltransferase
MALADEIPPGEPPPTRSPRDRQSLFTDLSPRSFLSKTSIFRHYQDLFLERHGSTVTGGIIEIGGEAHYRHQRHFPHAQLTVTNIDRDYDVYLDVTKMDYDDATIDAFLCVSVLEHVDDPDAALREIERTLKPGGVLLLATPFMFPKHDEVDYLRFSPQWFDRLDDAFDVEHYYHLGGRLSSVASMLQRPIGSWKRRHACYKALGLVVAVVGRFDVYDESPVGIAVVARKRLAA